MKETTLQIFCALIANAGPARYWQKIQQAKEIAAAFEEANKPAKKAKSKSAA